MGKWKTLAGSANYYLWFILLLMIYTAEKRRLLKVLSFLLSLFIVYLSIYIYIYIYIYIIYIFVYIYIYVYVSTCLCRPYFPFLNSSLINLYHFITKTRIPTITCSLGIITLMIFKKKRFGYLLSWIFAFFLVLIWRRL